MTTERVLQAARRVAQAAPLKQAPYVSKAGIWWNDVNELRAALDEAGIEWRPRMKRTS